MLLAMVIVLVVVLFTGAVAIVTYLVDKNAGVLDKTDLLPFKSETKETSEHKT